MPYKSEWVPPEEFHRIKTEHGDLVINHGYNDGDMDKQLEYWFTLEDVLHDDGVDFDIRMLPQRGPISEKECIEWAYRDGSLLKLIRMGHHDEDWEFTYEPAGSQINGLLASQPGEVEGSPAFRAFLGIEYSYWRGTEDPRILDFSMGAMGALANVLGAMATGISPSGYRKQVEARDPKRLTRSAPDVWVAAELKRRFPWIGTDESIDYYDQCVTLTEWYRTATAHVALKADV